MKNFTKKEKIEIYQKAYLDIESREEGYGFICHTINNILNRDLDDISLLKEFPELCLFTKNKYGDCEGAFLTEDNTYDTEGESYFDRQRAQKLVILGFCITMCK